MRRQTHEVWSRKRDQVVGLNVFNLIQWRFDLLSPAQRRQSGGFVNPGTATLTRGSPEFSNRLDGNPCDLSNPHDGQHRVPIPCCRWHTVQLVDLAKIAERRIIGSSPPQKIKRHHTPLRREMRNQAIVEVKVVRKAVHQNDCRLFTRIFSDVNAVGPGAQIVL